MSDSIIPTSKAVSSSGEQDGNKATFEPAIERPAGKVEIDGGLSFEVEALAHASASELARQIVDEISAAAEASKIVFLDDKLAAAVSLHRALEAQCDVLRRAFESTRGSAVESLGWLEEELEKGFEAESFSSEEGPISHGAPASMRRKAVDSGLAAAANILSYFGVDETYSGRSADVSERALVFEIARHCDEAGIDFTWPSLDFVIRDLGRAPTYLMRLNQVEAAAVDANHRVQELSERVDGLDDDDERLGEAQRRLDHVFRRYESASAIFDQLQQTFLSDYENEGLGTSELAQLGERVSREAEQGNVHFLTAKVEKAGGSYRVRRHLWQAITLEPPLTFSGGSIVSFALLDDEGNILASGCPSDQTRFLAHPRRWSTEDGGPRAGFQSFFLGVAVTLAAFVAMVFGNILESPELDVLSLMLGAVAVSAFLLSLSGIYEAVASRTKSE